MTEQKETSAKVDETPAEVNTTAASTPNERATATPSPDRRGMALSAVAIVIALAVGAGLWLHAQQQSARQEAARDALAQQVNTLQQQASSEKQQLTERLVAQQKALESAESQQQALVRQLDELNQKVTTLSGNDTRTWLLAQADYLVKLAGRKLWSDQDVTTAAALLKSADSSLAEMNDPSLIDVRRALTQDISDLSAVSQVDYDGIILKLNQLANGVDNLRLADNNSDDTPMDEDGGELSTSLREWRQNLVKSWHAFMDDFITVRRRDSTAEPLLAPNQDVYLRENIRSRLLIAAQAVPRHQNEIYSQSVDTVSAWVRAWFDTNDPATKAFLAQLDALSEQNISMDVPDSLSSQPLLDKLMQTRVRNLLAQPSAAATPQTQQQQGE
ncbi:uroporphyrinogen-III C-methyltransferase [Pantoea sp. 1.19]|uniref:uroporphyrinogen-III C-methyltransferase n=1 Tax=Pantoea sp. 1.19 TaxID=1925589 RepID=UPI0009488C23|nr:uroporphyrinogen-III C-methyltransferase [Pantoea sp. 1.19]